MVLMTELGNSGRVSLKANSFAFKILNLKGMYYPQEVKASRHEKSGAMGEFILVLYIPNTG